MHQFGLVLNLDFVSWLLYWYLVQVCSVVWFLWNTLSPKNPNQATFVTNLITTVQDFDCYMQSKQMIVIRKWCKSIISQCIAEVHIKWHKWNYTICYSERNWYQLYTFYSKNWHIQCVFKKMYLTAKFLPISCLYLATSHILSTLVTGTKWQSLIEVQ